MSSSKETVLNTADLSKPHYSPIAANRETLSVWVDAGTTASVLLGLFNRSARFQFIPAKKKSAAKLQIIDWQHFNTAHQQSAKNQADLLAAEQELPTLIIADDSADLFLLLDASSNLDPARLEIVNTSEPGCSLLDARIARLLQTETQLTTQKLISDNSQVMLDTVMRHSNDWIVIKSLDHRFLQVSKKFCHTFDMTPEEIIGKNDLEIGTSPELVLGKPGTDWKGYWALDKEVTDAGDHVVLQPVILEEDELQEMRETTDKIPLRDYDGNIFALFVCVAKLKQQKEHEQTDKNRSEEEFESFRFWETKHNLEHSPALVALNDERKRIEALQHESERAYMAKNQFIAAASHDLRQPLHALGLYLGALQKHITDDGHYLLGKLELCVSSLNDLLNSLLDVSRLDANVVSAEMSSFLIDDLLQPLGDDFSSIATGRSLHFFCGTDGSSVYSDPVLLTRIIRNLVTNAFNHTEEGKVTLTARKLANHVRIEVSDTGAGIPRDKQELVFEEFTKLGSHSQHATQGLGLGLSIVKRLCLLLGAQLELQSTLGKGTRVSVLVPLGLTKQSIENSQEGTFFSKTELADQSENVTRATGNKLILVIDDDKEVCEAVEAILTNSGYRTITGTDPYQALESLQDSSLTPDAILIDFRLSEKMTGLDAISIISDKLRRTIPALIVTGDTTGDGLKEISDSGYLHMHKPVKAEELLKNLHQTVKSAEQTPDNSR